MAAEKKKTDKKTDKKPVKKIAVSTKKQVKKSTQNTLDVGDLVIQVPLGGQVIKHFELTPYKPVGDSAATWLLVEDSAPTVPLTSITVGFYENPDALERQLERAVLVVTMKQDPNVYGTWRFALGGVATDSPDSDPHNDIDIEFIDNGLTMLVYVRVIEDSEEDIGFRFVASFAATNTGAVSIYESQDPSVIPRRPT